MSTIFIPAIIVGVILLLIIGIFSMWKRVPQDKAIVITGLKKRVITGGGGFVVPLLERTDKISLENMQIDVRIEGALTGQGVGITADGVAVVKVKSDTDSILSAAEQFNTSNGLQHTLEVIEHTTKNVMEGKLREIVSKMTIEEIYRDREKFASHVQEVAAIDLAQMGLELKVLTIKDISDKNGYLEALGKPRIAAVKRDAQIAEAEAAKETKIKTAEAVRLGEAAKLLSETQIAESTKDKELKVQDYRKEQERAKAISDLAYEIEANKAKREVTETEVQVEITKKEKEKELADASLQVEITRKQREIELAEKEAMRKERELEATVKKQAEADKYMSVQTADAVKYKEIADAEARARAIELEGKAKSEALRLQGMAEVDIIRERGKAEAEAMMKKAEAYKQYNDAAMTQMIIEKLPEIAKAVSEPLSKTEKIVIVDNGSGEGKGTGAAKVTGYVSDIMSQLPETVEALTGVNIMDFLNKATSNANEKKEENNKEVDGKENAN
ncbi:flotillin family protein [Clostridium sp. P21]|uniref:Flotillin family protein n=1 Tax=Clostridium muellerianum TaxID=2716538 RepID=A0A7Y0HP63_9CLOT|nr:SPFH domain-containing protein [Clostridium muellerianum]NMM63392.1 flotillin family protein [Clostridium muellerianum]